MNTTSVVLFTLKTEHGQCVWLGGLGTDTTSCGPYVLGLALLPPVLLLVVVVLVSVLLLIVVVWPSVLLLVVVQQCTLQSYSLLSLIFKILPGYGHCGLYKVGKVGEN
jgi:hypothetical protein